MPRRFERELFDLIEAVSLGECGGGFVRHLAAALHAEFATSLGLAAAAELREQEAGFAPVFTVGAPLWPRLGAAAPASWTRRKFAPLCWWVRRGVHLQPLGSGADGAGESPSPSFDLRLLPLDRERQHVLGFLTLAGAEAEEREIRFQVLGQLIRLFVDRHHQRARLDQIVALARQQQISLLQPELPRVPGHTAAAFALPAEEVGGDYHQLTPLSPRSTALAVADAKGKGFEAAVLVTALHTALRVVQAAPFHLEHKMELLNRGLAEPGEFRNLVSIFYGELNADGRLFYVNGSHPPPLVIRRDPEVVEELSEGGLFLGLAPGSDYRLGACQLEPGDLLVAYTDGWSELFNRGRQQFGAEGLRAALRGAHGAPPAEVIARIQAASDTFRDGQPFDDDRTLLVLRRDA